MKGFPVCIGQDAPQVAEFSGALQKFSAVHADYLSINVGGAVADQEGGQVGQFLRGAKAVHRITIESQWFELRKWQDAGESALGGNWTGSDRVHADAAIAPLDGEA